MMTPWRQILLFTLAPFLIGVHCSLLQRQVEQVTDRTTATPVRASAAGYRVVTLPSIPTPTLTPTPTASVTPTRPAEARSITSLTTFSSSPTLLGTTTTFSVTVSSGIDLTYVWDFGDGLGRASGPTPSYIYPQAGVYTATVTGTNRVSQLVATVVTTVTVAGSELAGATTQTAVAQQTLTAQQTLVARLTATAQGTLIAALQLTPTATRIPSSRAGARATALARLVITDTPTPIPDDDDDDDDDGKSDPPPPPSLSVGFSTTSYGIDESSATATITVTLSAPSVQAVTVNYATNDGTATAGSEYTATSGTLTFSPGQTSQNFIVPIINDLVIGEGSLVANLSLSSPTNAVLGSSSNATLTMIDTCTLHDAITAANTDTATGGCGAGSGDDTIDILRTGTINLTGPLPNLSSNIVINGPGAGNLTIRRDTGGDYRIFTISAGNTVTIAGVTISNGLTSGFGGGILNNGTVTMSTCAINGNSAVSGGGIFNQAIAVVTNCIISGNSPSSGGGGITSNGGTITVISSTISGNSSSAGGGILNVGGTVTVTDSFINGNSATNNGGAISTNSMVIVVNSTLSGNSTNATGGGIGINGGTVTLTDSTISNNSANGSGGGILNSNGTVTATNSTFSGNSANTIDGGGIYNNGTVNLANSTISGNSAAGFGGGIYNVNSTSIVIMINDTIVGNSAPSGGGGFYNVGGRAALTNTMVTNSVVGSDCNIVSGTVTSYGYNLIGDTTCSAIFTATGDITNTNPLLGPLQNNGGPTDTHALLPGSPAIDAGSCPGTTADQRGQPRPVNKPEPNADDGCDIGAFEVQ